MVDVGELAIEPEVQVDHRDTPEAIQLLEHLHLLPGLRQQQLEGIHRQGTDVGISGEIEALLALHATDVEGRHRTIGIELDLTQGAVEVHFTTQ